MGDADAAETEAKKVAAEADKDTAAAKSAASAAQAAADEAKKTKEANEKEAKEIQDKELKEANAKKAAAEGMIAKIDNAQCAKHAGCKGMEGYCCPTLNFAKMHLGSAKLDGATLACCGGSTELHAEAFADTTGENDGFGASAMMLSAMCGSAMTLTAIRLLARKDDPSATYQTM